MRRHLFTLAACMSLLLCLAVLGLWIRSYSLTDYASLGRVAVGVSRGSISLDKFLSESSYSEPFKWYTRDTRYLQDDFQEDALLGGSWHYSAGGFGIAEYGDSRIPEHTLLILLPLWFLVLIAAALPLWWMSRRFFRMRERGRFPVVFGNG